MYIGPRSPALVDVWMIVNIFACEKIEKTCAGRIELDHRISYTLRGSRFLVAVTRKAAFAIWWQSCTVSAPATGFAGLAVREQDDYGVVDLKII